MALTLHQQIAENIKKSANILILTATRPSADQTASALALSLALKKLHKNVTTASEKAHLPKQLDFFPDASEILPTIAATNRFEIKVDLSKRHVADVSYEMDETALHIYLNADQGNFAPEDVSAKAPEHVHDLIFVIGTPDLKSLGGIYEKNREFFFATPIINIDHHASNENFGQMNLVDVKASSTAEVLYALLHSLNPKLIDMEIGTRLLTGMIAETNGFKNYRITPKTLQTSASLIEQYGAEREKIVKHLFYSKTHAQIKLWGTVLARLKSSSNDEIVWAWVKQHDFEGTKTNPEDLMTLFDEIIWTLPEVKNAVIFFEHPEKKLHAYIKNFNKLNLLNLFENFMPLGNDNLIQIELASNEAESEKNVLSFLSGERAKPTPAEKPDIPSMIANIQEPPTHE